MPFTPVQAPKCKRCGKSVYQAEEAKDSDGGVWHKSPCFSCAECKKKLDSTSLNMHEGEIYCRTCHGKNFGPKGYGFGGGAGALTRTQ
ncbi:muscle LIM protein 1-like [Oculina patagonica]